MSRMKDEAIRRMNEEREAGHTPGPWRLYDVQADAWTRQVWTDEGHGSVMIATAGGVDKDANARLIAAAPELLAESENAWDCLSAILEDPHNSLSLEDRDAALAAIAGLRAAIKKAKGE